MTTGARPLAGPSSQRSSTTDDPLLGPLDPSIGSSAYASTSSTSASLQDDDTADTEGLGTIRPMAKVKSMEAPATSSSSSSYFDLTRRTAEAVERTHAKRGFTPYNQHHLLSPPLAAPPLTATQATAAVVTSGKSNGTGSARSLSVSRAGAGTGEFEPSRSHSQSRAASILFGKEDEQDEEDEGAHGQTQALLSESIKLLSALHEMNDAELDRQIMRTSGGALSLLRSVSRALADWREESASQQNELIKQLAESDAQLREMRAASVRREGALAQLGRGHGASEGEIERALARVSKQQTAAQKVAGQQKMLGKSLQEAMEDALGGDQSTGGAEGEGGQAKSRPVVIDATLRPKTRAELAATHHKTESSSIASSKGSDPQKEKARRKRSDSLASTSAASVSTSRKSEGTGGGLTDWASSLMPWGSTNAASKKAAASVEPSSPFDAPVQGEISTAVDLSDTESVGGRSVSSRRGGGRSRASSPSRTTSVGTRARHRQTANTLSIFGGIAWRRSDRKKAEESDADSDSDDDDDEGGEERSPAVDGLRAVVNERTFSGRSIPSAIREATNMAEEDGTVRVKTSAQAPALNTVYGERLAGTTEVPGRTTAAAATSRVPNVTRIPQIYGSASNNPELPLSAAPPAPVPIKTMELRDIVPKEARPPTLAGIRLDGVEAVEPFEDGDPFEVYGGAGTATVKLKPPRSPAETDSTLTDRYGFMYSATPADLRMLRQARAVSSTAPASLAGTRIEQSVESEDDAESSSGSASSAADYGHRQRIRPPGAARASSFLVGQAEKAQAVTSASAINVSTRSAEEEKADRKQTVKALLKQLDDMHEDQQAEQQVKWDLFLQERQEKMRRRSTAVDEDALHNALTLVGIAQIGTDKTGKEDWNAFMKLCLSGIPLAYRSQVWAECSGANELAEPGLYEELLGAHEGEQNQCLTQIDLDVHRTMPTNLFFGGDGPGVPRLRRLLVAFSWYDVEIGYCQAMNNIAATLLLTEPSEPKSFWLLVCLIEKIMPRDYYTSHLLTSQADQRVLIEYLQELLPKLWNHLETLGIDLPAVTFAWFLSLYTDCLPVEVLFRVWDLLFVEGMVTLFRIAIAIFQLNEKAILAVDSPAAFYSLMHRATGLFFHTDKLIQAASLLRDRIKQSDVVDRRSVHIEALRAELGLTEEIADPVA